MIRHVLTTPDPEVENAQVDYVFEQLAATGLPHALAVTITAGMIWWDIGGVGIVVWFLMLQSSHVMRIMILDRLWEDNQQRGDYRVVKPFLVFGMFATGCVWAAVPGFFMAGVDTETFIFISIVIAGMVAATLPALAAYLPAYLAFAIPLLVVLTYRYFSLSMEATALLTISYLAAVSMISVTINRLITQSITMDFKQRALLAEVTVAKEKAEQANLAKSRFLAAASHDLRQPLQALGLIMESLRLRLADQAPMQKLIQQGLVSHNALSELFNALLELSRLESNQQEIQRADFNLLDMLDSIVNEFKPMAAEKGLVMSLAGDDCVVNTDPVMFGRIIRNLLTNAIKFTEQGTINVSVQALQDQVKVAVEDTGIGIEPQDQEKVFDEYHQVSNKARRREEGIGLGLSVVKKICELLGHEIHLESTPGKGSIFTLTMQKGDPSRVVTAKPVVEFDISGLNVLVIDDNQGVLDAVSNLLSDWGCEVSVASSIDEALALVEQQSLRPAFILSDYRLEEVSTGIDAIEAVCSRLDRNIPGLLMSGDSDPDLMNQIRHRGYHLLRKPVKPAHLRKAIKQLID